MMFKPIEKMTDAEINEELAYWNANSTDAQWWRDITQDLTNQLKINANVRDIMASAQQTKIKQVARDFDWKSTADIMVATVFVFTMYLYMTHVVLS